MSRLGEKYEINGQTVEVFKINHDVNGNPRYVIHFLAVLDKSEPYEVGISYDKAVKKIHTIGGRKYTAKWFGGGLVFQSYNVRADLASIIPIDASLSLHGQPTHEFTPDRSCCANDVILVSQGTQCTNCGNILN